jgi:CRISPR-associated protein Cmr1
LVLEHASIVSDIPVPAGTQNDHLLRRVALPLSECLRRDWPHALGQSADGRLLVWKSTQGFTDWRSAMQTLAKAKIGFRTQFQLGSQGPFENRHLLAYPVTNHKVNAWLDERTRDKERLANQIRFKVAKNAEGLLMAYIFHLPCALPRELAQALGHNAPTDRQQVGIWSQVHTWLDNTSQSAFQRI